MPLWNLRPSGYATITSLLENAFLSLRLSVRSRRVGIAVSAREQPYLAFKLWAAALEKFSRHDANKAIEPGLSPVCRLWRLSSHDPRTCRGPPLVASSWFDLRSMGLRIDPAVGNWSAKSSP